MPEQKKLGSGDPIILAMIEAAVARRKARIVSAAGEGTEGDGPSDVLIRRIVDAFAEYERLVIRARTKAALVAKKARGERTGSVPYGAKLADDGIHLQPIPEEQRAIQLARSLNAQERSLRFISAELARRGFLARNGRPFLSPQAARMLGSYLVANKTGVISRSVSHDGGQVLGSRRAHGGRGRALLAGHTALSGS